MDERSLSDSAIDWGKYNAFQAARALIQDMGFVVLTKSEYEGISFANQEISRLRDALVKIVSSTQETYDYDHIGSGEFEAKYPDWVAPDPDVFMNSASQANETARAALEVKR